MNNARKIPAGRSPLHQTLTPYANRRKSAGSTGCFAPFRAPTPKKGTPKKNKVALAKEVIMLKEKNDFLDKELEELEKQYTEEELDVHIEKLHEYNDIKDIGQMLLGRLAEVEHTTTKELYARYGLELND
ncbi:DNA repair protein SWI5 homolog [Rhopilema esculentum]|uniref:DNA repair protein SWI5 homolog n=1 Tax=Rhopilema esculentum TaxID=499914 RepID=UPI0031E1B800|eukprot:gene10985-19824_t